MSKNTAMMINKGERLLSLSNVDGDDCWLKKNSKGLKKGLNFFPLSLLMIQRQIILKRE
jgi:hypothetical protein